MALDRPAVRISSGRWLHLSGLAELGVIVALTVVVVVVAAIWNASPMSDEPEASTSAEPQSAAPASVGAVSDTSGPASVTTEAETGAALGRLDSSRGALPYSFERYQVQRGESLSTIARARGVSVSDLVAWNSYLEEDSTLIRGEWIWIPQWSLSSVADEPGRMIEEGTGGRGGG